MKTPGAGWSYVVYDKLDRPVLSQSANLRSEDQWNFVKFDVFGRVVLTGLFNSTETEVQLQGDIDTWTTDSWEVRSSESGNIMDYSNTSFPEINLANDDVVYSVQYYDDYSFDMQSRSFEYFGYDSHNESISGLPTGSLIKILDDDPDSYLLTLNFYDTKKRLIQQHSQNHLSGWDVNEIIYNFDYSIHKTTRFHFAHGTTFPIILKSRMEYDPSGRINSEYASIGAGTSPPEKLVCQYEYNALGQLVRQNLDYKPADEDFLQQIDYRYNIRGWLTSINNAELENDGTKNLDDSDVFGEEIYYNKTDAITVDNTQSDPFVSVNQFNGNISAIRWKSRTSDIVADTKPENLYCYRYDDLNRMTASYFAKSEVGLPAFFNNNYHVHNEEVTYDVSGNIRKLKRGFVTGTMDDLTYSYEGDKLMQVDDGITNPDGNGFLDGNTSGNDYNYDDNGNLVEDLNKSLNVEYNYLNLPKSVTDGTDDLIYLYDASGRKLRTIDPDAKVHDYVSGIEYYDDNLLFINTAYGRVKPTGPQDYCSSNFTYEYFIKDHLGSVRAVISREENAPVHNYQATMETAESTSEESLFYNVAETRQTAHSALQAATSSSEASLTDATDEPIGPAKVLYVQEGDKISIDVKYYYQTFSGTNSPRDVEDVLAQLANFFILTGTAAPVGLESSWAASTFTANTAVSDFIDDFITSGTSTTVLGYLAYITLDEEFNFIESASGILPVTTPNSVSDLVIQDVVMPKNGYIYIYVANESPTAVYFDNLTILHKKSNVSELNDYYPFGLLNQFQSQTSLSFDPINKLQYQGKELQSQLNLNTLDFGLRQYDATLGRWGTQDPKMQYFNPYVAMGNNPVSHIDPDGGWEFTQNLPGDGSNNAETPLKGGGGGSATYQKYMRAAQLQDSYIGCSGSSWTYNAKGERVRNEAYFDQLMNPAGGVTFTFHASFVNNQCTGLFLNKFDAELSFGVNYALAGGFTLMSWLNQDHELIMTNDGNGGAKPHIALYDKNNNLIGSNWNGDYDPKNAQSNGGATGDPTYNNVDTGLGAFGIGWSTKEIMIQGAVAEARGISMAKVNNISNIRALGATGAGYMNVVKQVSRGTAALGAVMTFGDGFVNGFQAHHAADLGIQAAIYGIGASVPVAGWIVGGAYFLGDMYFQSTHNGMSITQYYLDSKR